MGNQSVKGSPDLALTADLGATQVRYRSIALGSGRRRGASGCTGCPRCTRCTALTLACDIPARCDPQQSTCLRPAANTLRLASWLAGRTHAPSLKPQTSSLDASLNASLNATPDGRVLSARLLCVA